MKISTRGRYALRLLTDLARHGRDGCVTLKEVSERQRISKKYLEQIALSLTQAGILHGSRGHQGGYRLVGSPADYTALQILVATEGSMAPVVCLEEGGGCSMCDVCDTLPMWEELDHLIADYLAAVTLQDLADGRIPRAVLELSKGTPEA